MQFFGAPTPALILALMLLDKLWKLKEACTDRITIVAEPEVL
jgi:hypothetical protein